MIMCTFGILSCLGWKAAELICDLCYSCSLLQHNGPGERKKRSEPSNNKTNIQLYSMWLWLWLWMLNACGTSILMEQRINCRFISHPFRVMVSVRWKCWLAVEKWPTQILSCTAFGDCNQTVCVCVCAFGFQHPNYVVIISILFDVFHFTKQQARWKRRWKKGMAFIGWNSSKRMWFVIKSLHSACSHKHQKNMFQTNSLWKFICVVWCMFCLGATRKKAISRQKSTRLMGPFITSFFSCSILMVVPAFALNLLLMEKNGAVKLHVCLTNFERAKEKQFNFTPQKCASLVRPFEINHGHKMGETGKKVA